MATSPNPLEPHFFRRIFKEKVWGGRRLSAWLGEQPPFAGPVGETWEISDYPGEETVVRGGSCEGISLRRLMEEHGDAILGRSKPDPHGRFPLLVKFLDAQEDLSVQVHPPDGPLSPTGWGKTEAWYVLDSADGSVICGLREGADPEAFRRDADGNGVVEHLHQLPVRAGDCIYVPAGQTHAIRSGVVLAEIQQTNDLTYRLYDWGRVGLDGKPRETHVEEALRVADFGLGPGRATRASIEPGRGMRGDHLASGEHFRLDELRTGPAGGVLHGEGRASVLVVTGGRGHLESLQAGDFEPRALRAGDVVLMPGGMEGALVVSEDDAELKMVRGAAL